MEVTWQLIWAMVVFGSTQLLALARLYYALKADNAKVASDTSSAIDKVVAKIDIAILAEKSDRLSSHAAVKADMVATIAKVEKYVDDLTHRVTTLESGQDEWTKSLRNRTHQIASELQVLVLKVDRLERPGHYATGTGEVDPA